VVFCRTKHGADRLADRLARSGLASAAIHGNRSQSQRERALGAFRAGRLHALVATDIAARGIHVDAVPLVVHFDLPADATDYVHRSGRTGRAGADGTVVSLIGTEHLAAARLIQRRLGLSSGVGAPDVASLADADAGRLRTGPGATDGRPRTGPGVTDGRPRTGPGATDDRPRRGPASAKTAIRAGAHASRPERPGADRAGRPARAARRRGRSATRG
jgi:superfamily II DNA/RNA helicase